MSSIVGASDSLIYAAEGGELLKLNIGEEGLNYMTRINPPRNIGANLEIYKVDEASNLWGGSSNGLFYFDTKLNTFKFWGITYGFKNVIGLDFLGPNSLIVATSSGLLKGPLRPLFNKKEKISLNFKAFKIFNKSYFGLKKSINDIDELTLDYKQNFLTISFSLMEIMAIDNLNFEYKMEGLREEWINLGSRNYVEFSHLNPGEYVLQVRQKSIGLAPLYSKKLSINITPPFWQTTWFRLLTILLIGGLFYAYFEHRRQQLKGRFKKELEFQKRLANVEMMALKSQMNPHFVFNCLNTIKLFVLENKSETASRYISDFAKLLRMALNDSRIDLTSLKNEIESIRLYIELEKMRFEKKFDYNINYPEEFNLEHYKVPPMLLQPFVENAIQHGLLPLKTKGKLIVDIKKEDTHFVYTILDNGIGRAAAQKNKEGNNLNPSLGINITNDRLQLIKTLYGMEATIEILDLMSNGQAAGTKVIIRLPILAQ